MNPRSIAIAKSRRTSSHGFSVPRRKVEFAPALIPHNLQCRNCGNELARPILYTDNLMRNYCSDKCRREMPGWK